MITQLKSWGVAILAVVASILYALLKSQKAKNAREKLRGVRDTLETERKAGKALNEGLKREAEVRNESIDTSKRDHFS